MDTTSKYIKMCKEALPDIGGWGWKEGDFGYRRKKIIIWNHVHAERNEWGKGEICIPLPRQDQLQEMVKKEGQTAVATFCRFRDWLQGTCIYDRGLSGVFPEEWISDISPDSLEQLWLAFVMYEKYRKTWNQDRKEWIQTRQ